ncbi:2,3-bisphosphoglycerate-dependent phosphoglycerate mutase [Mesorhizobium sp. RP14(2022)]|uniref:2,3-bisphosphoglycerate-dependent phosphoglycerate mutase n=1 Tax=Mesorhizobium liriopis TaxID=2953882 RepID=A0ABT1C3X9_9HYPH|nr:2,3-bisphosphoglycerate-dependent phosphoglycerate mutase [Mesorhizobium liriopis]MCO6049547.1 2,3-bisphosphoglycerate-dependent phosphoglycerate mutase [Mesorhizobium liriopis]
MTGTLVLIRHGQSDWNLKNLFTGWRDVELTETGRIEALAGGQRLKAKGLKFDIAFTSALKRAQNTCQIVLDELGQSGLETVRNEALNERDYGDLSGLNKDDARAKWGEEQVYIWRRSYDVPPPGGESLKDTGARVWPYYIHEVQPHVLRGQTVLVAAHGNSLRALIMALEGIAGPDIVNLELATGVPIVYRLNADSTVASKEILAAV